MSISVQLDPAVRDLAIAIGLVQPGGGGSSSLNEDFFRAPWNSVSRIFADQDQRAALIAAMEELISRAEPALLGVVDAPPGDLATDTSVMDAGSVRTAYPLLGDSASGQIYVVIVREGQAPGAPMALSIAGEVEAEGGGPGAMAELVLFTAQDGDLAAVAGSPAYPLTVTVSAPLGSDGTRLSASLKVVAPPDEALSRFTIRLDLPDEAPLEFDIGGVGTSMGRLALLLIELALSRAGTLSPESQRLLDALPELAGLAGEMPELPLSAIMDDGEAFRTWLAAIATTQLPDGRTGLGAWVDALGTLIGMAPGVGAIPAGTQSNPYTLRLADSSAASPGLALLFALLTDPADGTLRLTLSFALDHAHGLGIDAALRAEARLFSIPLSGSGPTRVLEQIEMRLDATASGAALVAETGPAANRFGVGGLRAGLRCAFANGGPAAIPLIELTDVTLAAGGVVTHHDVVDLSTMAGVADAADGLVEEALENGMGAAGAEAVDALRVLLGLGTTPGLDLAHFAASPSSAIGDYYRALLAGSDGWSPVAEALAVLLGTQAPEPVGLGTHGDPWRVPLDALATPDGSNCRFELAVWNAGDADAPRLALALRSAMAGHRWHGALTLTLLDVALPGGTQQEVTHWMPRIDLSVLSQPSAWQPSIGGVRLTTGDVALTATWKPGAAITLNGEIEDIVVNADGADHALGTLSLGDLLALDAALPDLGLGIDAEVLWPALRALLARSAGSVLGEGAEVLLGALGISTGTGETEGLPSLELPQSGDLGSLLRDPEAAVLGWLAGLLEETGESVIAATGPAAMVLVRLVRAITLGEVRGIAKIPVLGGGSERDPWRFPIGGENSALALTAWLGPDGPPDAWRAASLEALADARLSAEGLLDVAHRLRGHAPWLGPVLEGRDTASATVGLETLARLFTHSDGLLPIASSAPLGGYWETGHIVRSDHAGVPANADAIAQASARIATLTDGLSDAEWAVILLAPGLAGPGCWEALLDEAGAAPGDRVSLSLRLPGIPPWLVDPGPVAAATWYTVDIGDDGETELDDSITALMNVVDAIRLTKPSARILLVSHSWHALAAEGFAARHPAETLGLIAMAAPLGVPVDNRDRAGVADAVRMAAGLAPAALSRQDSAFGQALALLGRMLDGYPSAEADGLRVPDILAADCWGRHAPAPKLHDVPALAIPAILPGRLLSALAEALAEDVEARTAAMPAHLHWGVDLALDVPDAPAGELQADVRLRLALDEIALADAQSNSGRIEVSIALWREAGWLVGDAAMAANETSRIRRAELRGSVVPDGDDPATVLEVALHDAGLRAQGSSGAIGLEDPRTAELLDTLVNALDEAAAMSPSADTVLALLEDVGFARRATATAPASFLADALATANADGAGWFASIIPPLLDRSEGLLGLARAPGEPERGGPWRYALPGLPAECRIDKAPWRVAVALPGTPLSLAGVADLAGSASVRADTLEQDRTFVFTLGGSTLQRDGGGRTVLSGAWLDEPVALFPPAADATGQALARAVPHFLADAVVRSLAEQALGGTLRLASLVPVFANPGVWLAETFSSDSDGLPDAARIDAFLRLVAQLTGLESDGGHAIAFPDLLGLSVTAEPPGAPSALAISLATFAPVALWQHGNEDATLDLALSLAIDDSLSPNGGGAVTLHVPLPDGAMWEAIEIRLAATATGLQLSVSTESGVAVTILPQLSGIETLFASGIAQILPLALDKLALATVGSPVHDGVLDVAAAMDLYDASASAGQGFQAKSDEFAAFLDAVGNGDLSALAPDIADALAVLLNTVLGAAATASATDGAVAIDMSNVLGGTLVLEAGFASQPAHARLAATGIEVAPLEADLAVRLGGGGVEFDAAAALAIAIPPGTTLAPALAASLATSGSGPGAPELSIAFHPIGLQAFGLELAPSPATPSEDELLEIAQAWLLPLAGNLLLSLAEPLLDEEMWNGGTTIGELLVAAGLATRSSPAGPYSLAANLPTPPGVLRGGLELLGGIDVPLTGDLALSVVSVDDVFGLALRGSQRFVIDSYALTLMLGLPDELDLGWGDAGNGVGLLILDLSGDQPALSPGLQLGGIGASFGKASEEDPLVKVGGFQLGGAGGYLTLNVSLSGDGAPAVSGDVHGAVEVSGVGMVISTTGDGGNAVAASLIKSDGGGDPAPSVPPFDMLVGSSPDGFAVSFSGQPHVTIEVNRTFGPLHIDEIDLVYNPIADRPGEVGIALDASVAIASLEIATQDLGLFIPLDRPADLGEWRIDLAGLGVDFSTSVISIGGGLLKATLPDSAVEYRGTIAVDVAGYALSAIGAYAQPSDDQGSYTSLFVFLAVSAPIGGPPYLFVTGLAGGAGYNRRLLTPRDPTAVPGFPLVVAMDDSGSGDPMDVLERIGSDIPPSRGAFWVAAGVRFSTFELLKTTALVTVSIDRGFEVNLMGLMRLTLPPVDGAAIVSLELALAAKYSTIDQVLSIRAELTDNSWLISRDCRLTGGFAFLIWFNRPEVLLTVGGYSRNFSPPDYYPAVPRVGFHWSVGGGIVVKGGSFFTITHSAVMVGGSLEASYHVGSVRAWFIADLDVIIAWDPFHYLATAMVEVGVHIKLQACAFGVCVSAPPLELTIGADLLLEGPPLNGLVTVNAGVTTIRIPFGSKRPQPFLTWSQIREKYVGIGSVASIAAGGIASDDQTDGSEEAPWRVASEFALRVESKMPATALHLNGLALSTGGAPGHFDLVPAGPSHGRVSNRLEVTLSRLVGSDWLDIAASDIARLDQVISLGSFPAAVWDGAASHTDSLGNQVVDTDHPMLAALSTLELKSAPAIEEATGSLEEIPFSAMVEEQAARPLSFGIEQQSSSSESAPVPPDAVDHDAPDVAVAPIHRLARVERNATIASPVAVAPLLSAVAIAGGGGVSATARVATQVATLRRASIWSLTPGKVHGFRLSGGPQRLVELTATGAVLSDGTRVEGVGSLSEGARTLIVADPEDDEEDGWDLMTQVIQAGPATYIAGGTVITAPVPWSPRNKRRRKGRARATFEAARLARAIDTLVTRFPTGGGKVPSALVVRLDKLDGAARIDDVGVSITGAAAGPWETLASGTRTQLVIPLDGGADSDAISVSVRTGAGWQLAGVVATREAAPALAGKLAGMAFTRHTTKPRAVRAEARLELELHA